MITTAVDATSIQPLTHHEAMRCQAIKLNRVLTLLQSLDGASWAAATDCPAWDVGAMYQHVLGAREAGAFLHERPRTV